MESKLYISTVIFSIDQTKEHKREIIQNKLTEIVFHITKESDIKIAYTNLGKPELLSPKGWFFNISNSKNLGVIALSNVSVGIDIENKKSKRDYKSIALEYFHNEENEYLLNGNSTNIFYHIWTRKESWIKQYGGSVWDMKNTPNVLKKPNNFLTWNISYKTEEYSLSVCTQEKIKNYNSVIFLDFPSSCDLELLNIMVNK